MTTPTPVETYVVSCLDLYFQHTPTNNIDYHTELKQRLELSETTVEQLSHTLIFIKENGCAEYAHVTVAEVSAIKDSVTIKEKLKELEGREPRWTFELTLGLGMPSNMYTLEAIAGSEQLPSDMILYLMMTVKKKVFHH